MAITDADRIGLLIGAGSMGKRHAKFLAQKYSEVIVVDRDPTLEACITQELRQQDVFFPNVESALSKIGTRCSQVTAIIATLGPDHVSTFNRLVDAGVKRILCEKPLSNSIANARQMVDRSVRDNVRFTVGLQRRRSGLVPQLLEAAEKHLGGLPVAIVGHGGAHCLMTTGMHWIDLAIDVFGEAPTSVTALAEPDMINPRGKDLEMWAGVAGWSFSRGRYLSLTYSNLSSVEGTLHMYCPTGRLDVAPSGDWQMYQRDADQIKNDPRITRVGEATFQPGFVVDNPTIHPTLVALNELDSEGRTFVHVARRIGFSRCRHWRIDFCTNREGSLVSDNGYRCCGEGMGCFMTNPLRLAIVGSGEIANFHVAAAKSAGFDVVGVAARKNSQTVNAFAQTHAIEKVWSDPTELVANGEWDALILAASTEAIIPLLKQALDVGKPVLVEKPISTSSSELIPLISYKKNVMVGFNRRFYTPVQAAKRFIQSG